MSVRVKIKLLGALSLLAILSLTALNLFQTYQTKMELRKIDKFVDFSKVIGELMGQVQKERSLNAVFISSSGEALVKERPEQIKVTNSKATAFKVFAEKIDFKNYDKRYKAKFDIINKRLSYLDIIRNEIKNQKKSVDEMFSYYDEINKHLIGIISLNAKLSPSGEFSKNLNAYEFFVRAKEIAAKKRALFSSSFIAENFEKESINKIVTLIAEQKSYISVFLSLAPIDLANLYEKKMNTKEMIESKEIAEKTLKAASNNEDETIEVDMQKWFTVISKRVEVLNEINDKMFIVIKNNINNTTPIALISAVVGAISIILILLVMFLLKRDILQRIHSNDWIFEPK